MSLGYERLGVGEVYGSGLPSTHCQMSDVVIEPDNARELRPVASRLGYTKPREGEPFVRRAEQSENAYHESSFAVGPSGPRYWCTRLRESARWMRVGRQNNSAAWPNCMTLRPQKIFHRPTVEAINTNARRLREAEPVRGKGSTVKLLSWRSTSRRQRTSYDGRNQVGAL